MTTLCACIIVFYPPFNPKPVKSSPEWLQAQVRCMGQQLASMISAGSCTVNGTSVPVSILNMTGHGTGSAHLLGLDRQIQAMTAESGGSDGVAQEP
jgi:hypothetical protein